MVYVQLTDIFDITPCYNAKTAMELRLEAALGSNGKNFWERFFPCDSAYPDDTIVYLFTEYQMKFILNWWNRLFDSSKGEARKNLSNSKQNMLGAVITTPNGYDIDRIHTCYVTSGFQPKLEEFVFGALPDVKERRVKNFFNGNYKGQSLKGLTEAERRQKLLNILAIRQGIEELFHGPAKKDEKWLCYSGPKVFKHKYIKYCPYTNISHL